MKKLTAVFLTLLMLVALSFTVIGCETEELEEIEEEMEEPVE